VSVNGRSENERGRVVVELGMGHGGRSREGRGKKHRTGGQWEGMTEYIKERRQVNV